VQSCELDAAMLSDDGTANDNYGIDTWNKLFDLAGKKLGNSFTVVADDLQQQGFKKAGFEDITVVNYKVCPVPFFSFLLIEVMTGNTDTRGIASHGRVGVGQEAEGGG